MKNYSRQRDEIINVIKQMEKHPTAEQIYEAVKKKDSLISRSTVYRNLADLSINGVLLKLPTTCGNFRYELIDEENMHGHVICLNCGKIEEFLYDKKIKSKFKCSDDFKNDENLSFIMVGLCSSCKNNLQKNS